MADSIKIFLDLVPIQFVVLLTLTLGATHILKVIGSSFPATYSLNQNPQRQRWVTYSLAVALSSGFSLGWMAAVNLPALFPVKPFVLATTYMIMCPFIGALLLHSDLRVFRGMKTSVDRKFMASYPDDE